MTMQLRKASRQKAKLRIGLAGPSGAGKTYSALLLASGITSWDKIAVIDTENMSADLYCDLGDYQVLPLKAPYAPERYIEAIRTCEQAGVEVIIIDSITHEWDGVGGCLEIQDKLGGRYQDWAKVTPRHRAFIEAILTSSCHVITTVRSKQDYEMTNDNGRLRVQKVGLKEVTREGFEYELTLSLNININHLASCSKDRTSLLKDRADFVITPEFGKELLEWAGKEDLATKEQIKSIKDEIKRTGSDLEKLFVYFQVSKLTQLSQIKAHECLQLLGRKETADKNEQK